MVVITNVKVGDCFKIVHKQFTTFVQITEIDDTTITCAEIVLYPIIQQTKKIYLKQQFEKYNSTAISEHLYDLLVIMIKNYQKEELDRYTKFYSNCLNAIKDYEGV